MRPLLAALTALMLASPAQAYEFDYNHQQLESTIEHLLEVTIDPSECYEGRYAGWISGDGIVVCGVNSPNHADFQDTLRHEGVHLAQRCKGYVEGSQGIIPIDEEDVSMGYTVFGDMVRSYPRHQQDVEAEAWYVASLGSAFIVDHMIRTQCSFAF